MATFDGEAIGRVQKMAHGFDLQCSMDVEFVRGRGDERLTSSSKKNQLFPKAKSRVAPDETTHWNNNSSCSG